jgi:AcrR family transcriptional regulator
MKMKNRQSPIVATNDMRRRRLARSIAERRDGPEQPMMTAHTIEETRADTRTRILDTADRLFRHYGYSKTTMADIARELEMSPANVYRFFSSKSELVQAICDRMLTDRDRRNAAILAEPGTVTERLKRLLVQNHHMTVEALIVETKVHEIVLVAMEEQWSIIQAHISRFTDTIEALVREGIAAGEFKADDPRKAARCVHQSYVSMIHPQVVASCMQNAERVPPEDLADFIIRAIKA